MDDDEEGDISDVVSLLGTNADNVSLAVELVDNIEELVLDELTGDAEEDTELKSDVGREENDEIGGDKIGAVLDEEAVTVEVSAKHVVVVIQTDSTVEELADEDGAEEIMLDVVSGLAVVAFAVIIFCVMPAQEHALLYSEG